MPFISKDWRSPGEAWVKTQEGWEKKKVLEHCKAIKDRSDSCEENVNPETAIQPHCHITIKSTKEGCNYVDINLLLLSVAQNDEWFGKPSLKLPACNAVPVGALVRGVVAVGFPTSYEIAGFNELDEAVKRLDFRSAVRDVRRFNYICALLDLLIGQQMTALSGCAQKVLLAMLEEVARHATASQHNPRGFRQLLNNVRALRAAERSACWGGPLGSQMLWHQHTAKIERILNMAAQMQIREPHPDTHPKLMQLPEECIREIILRLSDHRDLTSSAQTCEQMASIVGEQRIWRELTKFHFTPQQIDLVLPKDNEKIDWKNIYNLLKKTFGLNEDRQYAEMLSLCRYCRCLFWRSLGHPCIADQCPEFRARLQEAGGITPPSPVPPSAFLKFFSL